MAATTLKKEIEMDKETKGKLFDAYCEGVSVGRKLQSQAGSKPLETTEQITEHLKGLGFERGNGFFYKKKIKTATGNAELSFDLYENVNELVLFVDKAIIPIPGATPENIHEFIKFFKDGR